MAGLDLSSLVPVVEGLMLQDTVRISTPAAGRPVFNTGTGQYEHPEGDLVYEGIGAVQSAYTNDVAASTPGTQLPWVSETRSRYRMFTPLTAPIAGKDMLVQVVAVHAGGDVSLIGRQWRVQDPAVGSTLSVIRITMLDQITEHGDP
jgi:hypothetical protein